MGAFLSILKAIPGIISLVDKLVDAWSAYKKASTEKKIRKRKDDIAKLTTQLKKAKTDEERRKFLRSINDL